MSIFDYLRRRGFGWLPNEPDRRDFDFEELGLHEPPPDAYSLRKYVSEVLRQGSLPSCVAQAVAAAIMIRENYKKKRAVVPSRLFLYYNSRRMHQGPVKISGTYLRTCIKAMRKFGCPDEFYWPYTTTKKIVNRRPGWDPYVHAFARRGGSFYSIKTIGPLRVIAIKRAIAAGYPVCFGTEIDRAFVSSYGPTVVGRPTKRRIGGHAMTIIGYRTGPDGDTLFKVLNSWGPRWRNKGCVWLQEDYINWLRTQDLTIIRGWEGLR